MELPNYIKQLSSYAYASSAVYTLCVYTYFSAFGYGCPSLRFEGLAKSYLHEFLSKNTHGFTLEAAAGFSRERISGQCMESELGVMTLPIDPVSLISTAC